MATTEKKLLGGGLGTSTGVISVDGEFGPFVDLSNKYAGKSLEGTVSTLSETVEGKADAEDLKEYLKKNDIDDELSDYVKNDTLNGYYSKNEVDQKLTSAMNYQGSVATTADLEGKKATAKKGDVYNVTADGKNYAFDGEGWDDLSGIMDVSNLAEKNYVDTELGKKANSSTVETLTETVNGKADSKTVSDLTATVNGKADKSELAGKADTTTVNQLSETVDGKLGKTEAEGIYAKKTDIASGVRWKGSVSKATDLDALKSTAQVGDLYDVQEDGMNYVWNGTEFDAFAPHVDISGKADRSDVYRILIESYELKNFTGTEGNWTATITMTGLEDAELIDPNLAPATANTELPSWAKDQIGVPSVSGNVLTYTSKAKDKPTTTYHIQIVGFAKLANA